MMADLDQFFQYVYHQDLKIHEFIWQEATREAVDVYMDFAVEQIYPPYQTGERKDPLLICNDLSQSGLFPIKHAQNRMAETFKGDFIRPPTFIAYLVDKDPVLIQNLDLLLRIDHTRRAFKHDKRNEALLWLAAQQA